MQSALINVVYVLYVKECLNKINEAFKHNLFLNKLIFTSYITAGLIRTLKYILFLIIFDYVRLTFALLIMPVISVVVSL